MQQILEATPGQQPELSAQTRRQFMLATLRAVRARLQTMTADIDEIDVSLRHGMITAEASVAWLDWIGARPFMATEIDGGLIEIEGANVSRKGAA